MNSSEFRKLIREEVRKVIKESSSKKSLKEGLDIIPPSNLYIVDKEDEGLLDAVKKRYKVILKKKMPSAVSDEPLEIYKIVKTPYFIVDEAGYGAIYNDYEYNRVIAMIKDKEYPHLG